MMRKKSAVLSVLIIVCVVFLPHSPFFSGILQPDPAFAQGGAVLEDFALYSRKEIKLDNIGESRGNVGSNGSIDIKKGGSGSVLGSFQALGRLKNEAEIGIYGDVNAGVIEDKGSLSVSGQKIASAVLAPLILPELSFTAAGPNLEVPELSAITIAPGAYGRLKVKKGAVIDLSSGTYYFAKFEMEESAAANLDVIDGAIHINVVEKIKFKKYVDMQIVGGNSDNVFFNYRGTDKVKVEDHAVLRGILTAPSAKVEFKKGSRLEGAAYADSIHLGKGASFRHYAASMDGRPPTADAGGYQTALAGGQVEMDGSGSSDPEGDAITYNWSFVSFPEGSHPSISDPADPMPTFTADLPGVYVIDLAVDDGTYASLRDTATVTAVSELLEITDFVLYADDKIKIDEVSGGVGHVGANRQIHIGKGVCGTIAGDLRVLDSIKIDGEISVDGDVITNSLVDDHGLLTVTGLKVENARLNAAMRPLPAFSAEGPDLTVPESISQTLVPGTYGRVEVKKGATLQFTAGAYFLLELKTDDYAILIFDTAGDGIELNVVNKLELGKNAVVQTTGGSTRAVRINYAGKQEVEIEGGGVFRGTLVAPNAKVEFEKGSRMEGAVYAKKINLEKGVSFQFHANSPPVADIQTVTAVEDTPAPIILTGSDPDGDSLIFSVISQPLRGTLAGTAPELTYTPDVNFSGPDAFSFTVNDGTVDSLPATVNITVAAVNDTPVANLQTVSLNEDESVQVELTAFDVEGDSLGYEIVAQPSNGTLSGTAPNLTYTPGENYNGPDGFSFTVNDGSVDSLPATVNITVAAVNDAPVAHAGADQSVTRADTVNLDGSGSGDADNDTLSYNWSFISMPEGSTADFIDLLSSRPSFVADLAGFFEIELVVKDDSLDSVPHRVTISVSPMMVKVPDVTALSQAEAGVAISEAGLVVGTLTTEHSETVPADYVISQSLTAGNSIEEFSAVDMTVSLGPEILPPTVSLSASCSEIYQGQPCILTWRATDALSANIDNGIGTVAVDDWLEVSPAHTTTYTITASGPGGTAVDSVQVMVIAVPEDVDYGLAYHEQQGGGGLLSETVRILNGNAIEFRSDLSFPSPNRLGLSFAAAYNSRSNSSGSLGIGWTHTYSAFLDTEAETLIGSFISVEDETGRVHYFLEASAGVFEGFSNERTVVRLEAGQYIWYRLDGSRYGFSADGKLAWIDDQKENRLTLGYDAQGKLETVIDTTSGRTLTFYYVNGLLGHITGPATDAVADGIWVSYGYDSSQNLTSVTYADGSGFSYSYNDPNDEHNLTEKRNAANHLLGTWSYDSQDRCSAHSNPNGTDVSVTYVGANQVDVTDSYGTIRIYTMDQIKGQKRVTAMQGLAATPYDGSNLVRWLYDGSMNLVEVETAGGTIHQYQNYDARGNPGMMILAAGEPEERTITYTYHPEMDAALTRTDPSVLGPGNKITIWDYDDDYDSTPNENPASLLSRIIEQGYTKDASHATIPYEYVTTLTYNTNGQLLTIDGPLAGTADTVTFDYHPANGNLLSITRPLIGTAYLNSYDSAGRLGRVTDVNDKSEAISYDGRGRITGVTHEADGSIKSVSYNTAGLPETATDEDGVAKSYEYNFNGRLSRLYDADGNYLEYLYDAQDNLIERGKYDAGDVRTARKRWSYQQPNLPGKLWKEIKADDGYAEYGYDSEGNLDAVTDFNGNTATYGYDALSRVITVAQPGGILTSYDYDQQGNLASVLDAEGHETTYAYDDMGRVVAIDSPDSGTTLYVYNAAGNPVEKTDANGITVQYDFDALQRLTAVRFPDASQDITYSYDAGSFGVGRRTGMTDPAGTANFEYDSRGRLVGKDRTIAEYSFSVTRGFTPGGRLNSFVYPSGRSIDYTRYVSGRIQTVATTYNSTAINLVNNLSYNPFGAAKGLGTGSGGTVNNTTNESGDLAVINLGKQMEQIYTYDGNRNLLSIRGTNTPWYNQDFDYDDLNRLLSADGLFGTIDFAYDDVGNRLSRTVAGQVDTYTYQPGSSRLAQITGANPAVFSYDVNGNITDVDGRTFVYNQNNRLVRVEEGLDILGEYTYNGFGQRQMKEMAGVATVFHYDFDGNLIAESRTDGTMTVEYLYVDQSRMAMVTVASGALYFFHNNYLGTPVLMTDDTGTVVWEADYKPFGEANVNPNSGVVNNFRFAGQYYDQETGLHYNYHRYYDPKTGRYLTADPIGLVGGINLYTYTSSNPINFTDPLGLANVGMAGWGNVQFSIQGLNPGVHPVFQRGTFENQLIGKDLIKIGGFLRETSGFEGWANTLVWIANSIESPDDPTSVEEWLKWKGVNPGDLCAEKAEPWQPIMGGYNPEDPPPPPPNEPRWKKIARVIMKLIRAANPK